MDSIYGSIGTRVWKRSLTIYKFVEIIFFLIKNPVYRAIFPFSVSMGLIFRKLHFRECKNFWDLYEFWLHCSWSFGCGCHATFAVPHQFLSTSSVCKLKWMLKEKWAAWLSLDDFSLDSSLIWVCCILLYVKH